MDIVLKKAHITEKSMKLAQTGEYVFMVAKGATKIDIAKTVAEKLGLLDKDEEVLTGISLNALNGFLNRLLLCLLLLKFEMMSN